MITAGTTVKAGEAFPERPFDELENDEQQTRVDTDVVGIGLIIMGALGTLAILGSSIRGLTDLDRSIAVIFGGIMVVSIGTMLTLAKRGSKRSLAGVVAGITGIPALVCLVPLLILVAVAIAFLSFCSAIMGH